jgi:hypothetical protein
MKNMKGLESHLLSAPLAYKSLLNPSGSKALASPVTGKAMALIGKATDGSKKSRFHRDLNHNPQY